MKVVYIAGSYRAKTIFGRIVNTYKARKRAIKYWKAGYVVICPHTNSFNFDGTAPDEIFLKGYLELVCRSDIIVMLPGWKKSAGSRDEHKKAKRLQKIIIYE